LPPFFGKSFFRFFILNREEEKCKPEISNEGKVQTEIP